MFADERKESILKILNEKSKILVSELSEKFGISGVTIRRDLQELEREGKLKRTHGGALKVKRTNEESIYDLDLKQVQEKMAIANKAYELIKDGEAIIIDSSSTTNLLAARLREGDKRNITVVTNSFRVVRELKECKDIIVIHIGGQLNSNYESSMGLIAESTLGSMKADKAFIGVNGIDFERGITTHNINESKIKTMMLDCGTASYVLADSSKFNCAHLSIIKPIEGFDATLITDGQASGDVVDRMDSLGIKYIIA